MMNPEDDAISFFREQLVSTAMGMPLRDAVRMLRGALLVAGESEAMAAVRTAVIGLQEAAGQLDLISRPQEQLKLDLEKQGEVKP